jgi:hypothetical protein
MSQGRLKAALLALTVAAAGALGMTCPGGPADCPNPAVTAVTVEVLEKDGFTGRIRITAVATNAGLQAFNSSEGQQSLRISQGGDILATQPFEDLEPGASVSVSVETDWNAAAEFVADFVGRITYDPDILIDGNEENDDCRTVDNELTLPAVQVNEEFLEADDT